MGEKQEYCTGCAFAEGERVDKANGKFEVRFDSSKKFCGLGFQSPRSFFATYNAIASNGIGEVCRFNPWKKTAFEKLSEIG